MRAVCTGSHIALLAALLLAPVRASAQDGGEARALFVEGNRLQAEARWGAVY